MEILEFDGVFGDSVNIPDTDDIKAEGITVRTGNKVLHLTVTNETSLPEDDLKKEYSEKIEEAYKTLMKDAEEYKDSLLSAYNIKKEKLEDKIRRYNDKLNSVSVLPDISVDHSNQGLSVVSEPNGNGHRWYFNCVYAPKFINNRRIDPSFAKRLMTPISIEISVGSSDKVHNIRVLKIIGHDKFRHYHSLSATSDCWGDFRYSGDTIEDADSALVYARKVLLILDTINEFSLGTRNPKGLSRFETLKKHLLQEDDEVVDTRTTINSRNARSGFDTNVNDTISEEMVWTTA